MTHDEIVMFCKHNAQWFLETFLHFDTGVGSITWEAPIRTRFGERGFIDLMITADVRIDDCGKPTEDGFYQFGEVAIEAKTQIKSLGELIRQLRGYELQPGRGKRAIVVVSPDDRWQDEIRSQGFGFVHCRNAQQDMFSNA